MLFSRKFIKFINLFLISACILFYGCETVNDSPDSGSLLVKVTDAPFPIDFVESAIVTIDSIEIREKSGTENDKYLVISKIPTEFDLLNLRNGVTASLPEIEIPIGNYDLVRLYVENAKIVLKEGSVEYNLKVPSGDQTGIKIFLKPEIQIQGGLTAELLLDFDLSKSFVVKGGPESINGFNFKPVIRAVNNSLAGSIHGTVSDAAGMLEGVFVTITNNEESATAITDKNGYYEILGLMADDYSVLAIAEGYIAGKAYGISVIPNEKTKLDFNLMAK